ncbi:uncharacterized protein LOC141686504 [Apium graveolens]|uniref:uncharacterized protein LOC141686504 n=1 Tax=Apium graveolens TaxID=4045 RepID=UPI003D7BA056
MVKKKLNRQQSVGAVVEHVFPLREFTSSTHGLWLAEVFKVVYHGHEELTPHRQIGTIKVNDELNEHYLYKVGRTDKRKPSIRHMDEVMLTGPRISSISTENSLTIDVDLFRGAYKDTFYIKDILNDDSVKICYPLQRRIISKDGRGEIVILYAIYDNAIEAQLEIKLLADDNFTLEVYGVVAASTTKLDSFEHISMLFLKKPDDKIKVRRRRLLPLSRSIVAVPLETELIVDIHLLTGDENHIFEGTVKFKAERGGTRRQLVEGKKCKILVEVT